MSTENPTPDKANPVEVSMIDFITENVKLRGDVFQLTQQRDEARTSSVAIAAELHAAREEAK